MEHGRPADVTERANDADSCEKLHLTLTLFQHLAPQPASTNEWRDKILDALALNFHQTNSALANR